MAISRFYENETIPKQFAMGSLATLFGKFLTTVF